VPSCCFSSPGPESWVEGCEEQEIPIEVMTIFAAFWWFQFFLMFLLIRLVELAPDEVLAIHVFSSPLLLFTMVVYFQSGV
jgi:hypothetical protein